MNELKLSDSLVLSVRDITQLLNSLSTCGIQGLRVLEQVEGGDEAIVALIFTEQGDVVGHSGRGDQSVRNSQAMAEGLGLNELSCLG